MLEPVGSTSWHNRHLACLRSLNKILLREGTVRPIVLVVGPGAVTRIAAWLLNDAAMSDVSGLRKLIGDAARYGDQLLRRLPIMPLRSLEPVEVEETISIEHRLVVADTSGRVLSAVASELPQAECHRVDISCEPLPTRAEVVIAFNVVCRLDDPAAGIRHLVEAVRPGGWMLIDDRSAEAQSDALSDFTVVAPKIHRRRSEPRL
ncbi:MAG: methyltransferase domain-containing protein [Planctomycetota bacterium]